MSEEASNPAPEKPAEGGGGSQVIMIMAIISVLMLGGGFALAYFVLPKQLLDMATKDWPKQEAAHAEGDAHAAGAADGGHGEAKKDDGHGDAKKADAGHGEAKKDDGHGDAKKADAGHGEAKKDDGHGDAKKADAGHGEAKKEEGGGHGGGAEAAAAPDFKIEDLFVNTAGSRGARTAKVSLSIEADKPVLDEMTARKPRIIDTVSMVIGSKSSDELTAPTTRATLRSELIATLNAILTKGKVGNIYFLELLIQ